MGEPEKKRLAELPRLGWKEPRRWMPTGFVAGFGVGVTSKLGIGMDISGGKTSAKLLPTTQGTAGMQRIKTYDEGRDGALMLSLNRQLAGEKDFPLVGTVISHLIGFVRHFV